MWTLFWILLGAAIGYSASQRRGYSGVGGVLGGAILGPLAFLMYFVDGITRSDKLTKCPQCAEWVKPDAKICKHCKSAL